MREHRNLPEACQNLVRRFKLTVKPTFRAAAHGVAGYRGLLDTAASGALESAQFVARRAGRNAGQIGSALTVLTTRSLDGTEARADG